MEVKVLNLSETDKEAISLGDSNYINNKGAVFYGQENYKEAFEYYHLAVAMGNVQAISNLGYCYLYGRDIPQNIDLAVAYFKVAALKGSDYAAYKLGDIYESTEWNLKDDEKAVYYYRMAITYILGEDAENDERIIEHGELQYNPSLCFALGRALSPKGIMGTDIRKAYQFLLHARRGYEIAINNGDLFFEEKLKEVMKIISQNYFDEVRDEFDHRFYNTYYSKDDE